MKRGRYLILAGAIFLLAAIFLGFYLANPEFTIFPPRAVAGIYPLNETIFPPDFAAPQFFWEDRDSIADIWTLRLTFEQIAEPITASLSSPEWIPEDDLWQSIKIHSSESEARLTIRGYGKIMGIRKLFSRSEIVFKTSRDSVGAPIFFRDVPLPFEYALKNMEEIKWCLGDVASYEPPKVVLDNMLMCGNCHSFSANGSVLGMDVDYANDKGSYVIANVSPEMTFNPEKIITWSEYKRDEKEPTFGLLSQISPCGRYVVSTVKDRSVFVPRPDLEYSQLFFPLKGVLVSYDTKTESYTSLEGACDPKYVQSNPAWSPDCKYIIFARSLADSLKKDGDNVVLTAEQCKEYLFEGKKFKFDLYRIPFNEGKGGVAEPVPGASDNGKSNYFPRYSPDGKWIVFCQAESFMLLQPDSKLYIIPAEGGVPRLMRCNTDNMNSWHSWSPNGKWLVFASKINTPYTQLFLTHIDEEGVDSPPVLLSRFSGRCANIPEFVNIEPGGLDRIHEAFVDFYSYERKGQELLTMGEIKKAESAFKRSIELKPDFAPAHRSLGLVYLQTGRADDAEKEYAEVLRLDPKDPAAYNNLGRIYLNRQRPDEAIRFFDRAIACNPSYAPAYEAKGILYFLRGNYSDARVQLEQAVKADPKLSEAFFRLGTIYMIEQDLGKAGSAFRASLEGSPDNPAVMHSLGIVYLRRQEYEKAEEIFRKVLAVTPDNPDACFMLGETLSKNPATMHEAFNMYQKALEINPSHPQAHIGLGNLYVAQGDRENAIKEFEKALRLNPRNDALIKEIESLKMASGR